jgi:hypothetical protein
MPPLFQVYMFLSDGLVGSEVHVGRHDRNSCYKVFQGS